jgi:hypothetical protein
MTLATTTDMTVDQVKASWLPRRSAVRRPRWRQRYRSVGRPAEATDANRAEASSLWDAALTSRGMKIG